MNEDKRKQNVKKNRKYECVRKFIFEHAFPYMLRAFQTSSIDCLICRRSFVGSEVYAR
jgi:hypothetical protein